MFLKSKKGDLTWDEIGKLIIFLIIFITLLILVWLFKDKIFLMLEKLKTILSGGLR